MRTLSSSEQNHVESFNEVIASKHVEIDFSEFGILKEPLTENPRSITFFPEFDQVALGHQLRECNLRIAELSCRWRTVEKNPEIGGEFRLRDLYDSILRRAPQFPSEAAKGAEIEIFPQLRVIDFPQHAGTGNFTAIRIQEHVEPLEMWYYDARLSTAPGRTSGLIQMETSYCDYLAELLLTKGTFGWQYLFADISLRGIFFQETVEGLRRMISLFPEIFPGRDYSSLAARLEARL
ncbi:hypothetical protein ACFRMN_37655 [Streptomyces sp. NPDC056835]|uniref:hypothetical protein n=1 Tax=Streptomyces sp. NPDC056835 TaxID=3345956 RepID=UPI00367ADE90